jgi:hypothetical protein
MSYKITITKLESIEVTRKGDWCVVDKRPWTEAELGEEVANHYGNKAGFLEKNPLKEVRDYAPSWKGVETKVLEQTVENIDLAAVIKAVNGL